MLTWGFFNPRQKILTLQNTNVKSGIDEEMLLMIPQPVKGIVILFPVTEKYETFRKQEDQTLSPEYPKSLTFMKQTISNACGTIALLHVLLNNEDLIDTGLISL